MWYVFCFERREGSASVQWRTIILMSFFEVTQQWKPTEQKIRPGRTLVIIEYTSCFPDVKLKDMRLRGIWNNIRLMSVTIIWVFHPPLSFPFQAKKCQQISFSSFLITWRNTVYLTGINVSSKHKMGEWEEGRERVGMSSHQRERGVRGEKVCNWTKWRKMCPFLLWS